MTIAWEAWEAEAPKLVERAYRRGFVVLDPQEEKLFRPGEPYGPGGAGDRSGTG